MDGKPGAWEPGRRPRSRKARSSLILTPRQIFWVSLLAIFVTWEIAGHQTIEAILPTFSKVVLAFAQLMISGEFWGAFLNSTRSLVVGYSAAAVIGTVTGWLIGRYKAAEHVTDLYITFLLATPMSGIIPVISAFFGFGITSRIIVVFFFCFVYIVVNTAAGIKSSSASLEEMAVSFGIKPRDLFLKVLVPESLPYILTGLRIGIARAVLGMLTSEMILAVTGLGEMITQAADYYKTDEMFALVISVVLFSYALVEGIRALERKVGKWKVSVVVDE